MSAFFDQVLGFFEQLWDIISHTIVSTGLAIEFLIGSLEVIFPIFSYLPAVIGAGCICTVVLMTVKFIIGR